jgi:hypothetical protein
VPAWHNVTLIEAIWVLSGFFATFLPTLHMRTLLEDWLATIAVGRPALVQAAWGYLRREITRFIQGVCIVVIGVYLSVEPSPTSGNNVGGGEIFITVMFFLLSLLVSAQSHWDWKTRWQIAHLIAEGKNGSS